MLAIGVNAGDAHDVREYDSEMTPQPRVISDDLHHEKYE